ncbi:hypothetical protein AALA00_13515 [Lachnospiraceae bacterium 46-15]
MAQFDVRGLDELVATLERVGRLDEIAPKMLKEAVPIEGTVFSADDGTWKEQAEFATEAEAVAWVDKKANIGTTEAVAEDKANE